MPLKFSIIEQYMADYRDTMRNKTLLRHERYKVFASLRDRLQTSLQNYELFENELATLVINRIDHITSFDELRECHARAITIIESFFLEEGSVPDVHDLFRIIRDRITARVLKLVEEEMHTEGFGYPPAEYVWLGLGSEGRDEQTILTDQDNMIIYDGGNNISITDSLMKAYSESHKKTDITPEKLCDYYYEVFSHKAVECLHQVGFEKCKGGVMPSHERWRGSLTEWKTRIEERLTYDRGIFEPLDVIILTDARPISGNKNISDRLLPFFLHTLKDNKQVMKDFIQSAVLMPTALSFFGNFKKEKAGENKDKINIKLTGWAPLIMTVRMAALSTGIYETNTLQRIKLLAENNFIKKDIEEQLIDAYLILVRFRIMNQISHKGLSGHNMSFVRPDMLGSEAEEELRRAMKTIEALQKHVEGTLLFGQPI